VVLPQGQLQFHFDKFKFLWRDGWDRANVFAFTFYLQAPEGAKPVNVQMLECHVDHGIEDVVVFADAIWMQSLRQQRVTVLSDMPML
jgi:hypothetical protein